MTRYAYITDITPSRATVVDLADDPETLRVLQDTNDRGEIVETTDDTEIGDRVWLVRVYGVIESALPYAPF